MLQLVSSNSKFKDIVIECEAGGVVGPRFDITCSMDYVCKVI